MTTADELSGRLPAVLAPALGLDPAAVTVTGLHALTGGASRATWAFEAVTGQRRQPLILRTAPDHTNAGMELEAQAQAAAAAAGAPIARILVADDTGTALDRPFSICEAIQGETIPRRIQRRLDDAGRVRLLTQCAQALAAIHRADPVGADLPEADPLDEIRDQLDAYFDSGNEPTATFEWAFRRLSAHRPPPGPTGLVHGDFRMGNLIIDGCDLAAVLDWELVHRGAAYEDLAWFCIRAWRFGAPVDRGAAGLGSVDDFLAAYQRAGGCPVDRTTFDWWSALATLRWGVICRWQAERHLSGQTRSVELATIGRRVCETEWDLLRLLTDAEPGDGTHASLGVVSTAALTGDHGRPTAAELVDAVAEFLDTEVRNSTTGQVNFHTRVATNALRIVERELLDITSGVGAAQVKSALARLGVADESELAAEIRAGRLDQRADDVTACLHTLVRHRLAVAHPGYDRG